MSAKVQKIVVRGRASDEEMQARSGTGISSGDMVVGVHGDCDVYKPNGDLLLAVRKAALNSATCERAREQLYYLRKYTTDNRSGYSGNKMVGSGAEKLLRKDGRISRQTRMRDKEGRVVQVASSIIGYYDKQGGRFPFCRKTAFTKNEAERWEDIVPLVRHVSEYYAEQLPIAYASQLREVQAIHEDFRISGTVFTTLTVNNNVSGTVHTDKGDYKGGMGVLSYHCTGNYAGGELVFPRYKVFAPCGDRDVVFFDPHEWHGVNQMRQGKERDGVRISVVYYVRAKMRDCGSAREEAERAKQRYGGL